MTPRLPSPRTSSRALAGTGLAAVAATALSGCYYLSPAQTDASYDPGDGALATVGDSVKLNNVLVVTSQKGAEGKVEGLVTNSGDNEVTLRVQPTGGSVSTLKVAPHTSIRLDGKSNGDDPATGTAVTIGSTPVAPGEHTTIGFATGGAGAVSVTVPVLLDQPPYGSASASHGE